MKRTRELVVGWAVVTVLLIAAAVVIPPVAVVMFALWVITTLPVVVDLVRASREFQATVDGPAPLVTFVSAPGMIVLPQQNRDPRWSTARLQQSGHLHVDRVFRPLTDCPAGHYDYHELRGSSLDQVVRRCAWCSPSTIMWTEGLVTDEGSER